MRFITNINKSFITLILTILIVDKTLGESSLQIQPFSFPSKSVIGKRVSVVCTTAVGEKMEFKWFRNEKTLSKGMNVDIRSFSDLSTLVIDPLTEEDSGNYTCTASARGVIASYTTILNVLVPPSWNQIPNDIDALSGDDVTINCKGLGTPKPIVTWYRTQGEMGEFIPVSNLAQHTILSNGSLQLSSISKDDEGLYRCNVSNGIGISLLKTIVIRVIEEIKNFRSVIIISVINSINWIMALHLRFPITLGLLLLLKIDAIGGNSLQIQPFSFPSDSAIGKRVSVTCTPLTGEKMEFKWLRNGQEITQGRRNINIVSLPMFSNLIVDPLTSEDSGNYTCIVSTRGLTGAYTTSLNVLVPPSWDLIPTDSDASSGDSLQLNCKGNGKPQPSVTWTRSNGESLDFMPVSSSNQAIIFPNGSLSIQSIAKEDEGLYRCNISNGIGNSLIKTIMIKVIGMQED
ncbi:UNVERIFIED_CONTAM: Down syndrome cell adhesion molecule-like protein [Trichonephila clavipes]